MGLLLLNLQSNSEIYLDKDSPFIIGRGKVTGCADKRVSRFHGQITCTIDGKVNLRALHSNPCFFTRNGTPPVMQLNKNEEEVLNEGDCIGLLPNSYWYQITSKTSVNDPKANNLDLESSGEIIPKEEVLEEEDNQNTSSPKHSPSNEENNTPAENVCHEIDGPSCSGESLNINIPAELQSTCKLPLHMYEIEGQKELEKSLLKENENTNLNHSLGDSRERDMILYMIKDTNSTAASTNNDATKSPDKKEGYQDNAKDGANATQLKPGRPYCQYDSNCYRKNAQHKLEYSHPGDEDYIPYQSRPLCEYGANCYRRNLTHRRQFRHVTTQDTQPSQASNDPVTSVTSIAADTSLGATPGTALGATPGTALGAAAAAGAGAAAFNPGGSSNLGSGANREGPTGLHKRKRHSDKDRCSKSCHLSFTLSASQNQKRRRNSQPRLVNRPPFTSDFSYEDPLSSSDSFSSDFSSDDFHTSDDSDDDFNVNYAKRMLRRFY